MKPSFGIQLALALAVGLLGSCDSQRSDPPPAQPSSTQPATSVVRIRAASPFTPACVIVEVGAFDALTFTLAPAMLLLACVVAAWLPARRATAVNPAATLRAD